MSRVGELCKVTWAGREKSVSKLRHSGLLTCTNTGPQLEWLCGPGPLSSHYDCVPFDLVCPGPYGFEIFGMKSDLVRCEDSSGSF